MKSSGSKTPPAAIALRWAARGLSLVSVGLLLAFMVGEGFAFWRFTPRELALTIFFPLGLIAGLALGWRWEVAGGALAIGSVLAFYAVHFAQVGAFPRGPAFVVFAAPGLLFVLAGLARWRSHQQRRAAPTT